VHLLLVRHGQSFINLEEWQEGFVDAGLTSLGKSQAESLGQWMAQNLHIDALYTSSMARALETAACLTAATGIPAQPDHRLREFGNCYADGTPVPSEAMPVQYPDFWGTERPYTRIGPNGESWVLFRGRVGSFLEEIVAKHGHAAPETTIGAVCHAGVVDVTFDHLFNIGPCDRRVEVWTQNSAVVHWEYVPDSHREAWRLHVHSLAYSLTDEDRERLWVGEQ
jgi:broad specificity phosphatase PhoE